MKLDKDLADAVKNLPYRWRAWCNDCDKSMAPSLYEQDAEEFLLWHPDHDAGKVRSL